MPKPKRDYHGEYAAYYGVGRDLSRLTALQRKHRKEKTARSVARKKLQAEGRVHKGDGKDVDHIDRNPQNNAKSNIRVQSVSVNRARNSQKT